MPEQQRPDPYASSGKNSGTVFQFDGSLLEAAALPAIEPILDRPTKTGTKDDTSIDIPVMPSSKEPQQSAKSRPNFVREDGTIDSLDLRTMLISSLNRPGVKFVQGSTEKVSHEVAYVIIEWTTGVTKADNQTASEFIQAHESEGLIAHLFRETANEFKDALDNALKSMGRAVLPDPLPGTDVNLESLIKMDPVGACLRLVNTISPYDGTMGNALLMMRGICQRAS